MSVGAGPGSLDVAREAAGRGDWIIRSGHFAERHGLIIIVALGESLLDREQRGGVLMTVDLFPVRTVAERTATSWSRRRTGSSIARSTGPSTSARSRRPSRRVPVSAG